MAQKPGVRPSNGAEIFDERKSLALMDDSQSGSVLGFHSLPNSLHQIVANYTTDNKKDRKNLALLGKPHFTLFLSQHAQLERGPCWHFGCLSPEDQWKTIMPVNQEKKFLFTKKYQNCLDFLARESSSLCPFIIKVLIFRLDISSQDFPSALNDLQEALLALQVPLKRVQHVVFAIDENAFCCFSFKNAVGSATGRHETVDRQFAINQILQDLLTCWTANHALNTKLLLDHYLASEDKPVSDVYLSKFVISLSYTRNRDLFDAVNPTLKSSKLKWIYFFETVDDVNLIDQTVLNRCHAIYLDNSEVGYGKNEPEYLELAVSLENNPTIERIVINSDIYDVALKLPRPQTPLTNATPPSALIELTLRCDLQTCDIAQLNNGYFSNLVQLSIINGKMMGHLDSQNVPRLKSLKIQLRSVNQDAAIQERVQSLMDTGRPWQLMASNSQQGWSLASYEGAITNPQEERKEDGVQSRPLIKELMLVMKNQMDSDEWKFWLSSHPSLDEDDGDQNGGLLEWAPENVEKITAFCVSPIELGLVFKDEILANSRILTSLECHHLKVAINGDTLPRLQSLELNRGSVELMGCFPQLEKLSFRETFLNSLWHVAAPLLQSLNCYKLAKGRQLYIYPNWLPELSSLQIVLFEDEPWNCPVIHDNLIRLRFQGLRRVVFGKNVKLFDIFNPYQWRILSDLEVSLNASQLSESWCARIWECETLTLHLYESTSEGLPTVKGKGIVLPQRPAVKTLTVTEENCPMLLHLLDMPDLMDLTVPSPKMLGGRLRCPALKSVCFTDRLSVSDKEKCLDRATYEAIGAQPKWVYFEYDSEAHRMPWDAAPQGVASVLS